jgi:transcriptional regulator with XRE-family HTH domain
MPEIDVQKPKFADLLAPLIEAFGISPERFAEEIGAAPNTVRAWLRGESDPGWGRLMRIVEVYGVAPEKLLPPRRIG